MERHRIGIIALKFDRENFDPERTIGFCRDNSINCLQLYLDDHILSDSDYSKKLREAARDFNISLLCHAPVPLNHRVLSNSLVLTTRELLAYQDEKKLIAHFDENQDLETVLTIAKELNRQDIVACVENYFNKSDKFSLSKNIRAFNAVFAAAFKTDLKIRPVLDLPRLFISKIADNHDPIQLSRQTIMNAARYAGRALFHLIDFSDTSQERRKWCALGQGLMPYREIFDFAQNARLAVDECILEFETADLVLQSLAEIERRE